MRKNLNNGFTIVELLVVIVVIGILAAITIVSYSGIANKAIIASLQSDLDSDNKILKMYNVEYGYYPTTINSSTYCPATPNIDNRYCLKASTDTTLVYSGNGQTFSLRATKSGKTYYINETSSIASEFTLTIPTLSLPTSQAVGIHNATMLSSITSDGGSSVTDLGFCWGTTTNPTTNCTSIAYGSLTPHWTTKIATAGSFSANVMVSPDGKYVYVNNEGGATISMYGRNSADGSLSPLTPATIAAGHGAHGMVISPDGNYLYVSSCDTNTISMYSRDSDTGLLAPLVPATIVTGSSPYGLAMSPDGKFLYTGNEQSDNISMYSRDSSTGLLASLGTIAAGDRAHFPVISPNGKYLYVSNYDGNTITSYTRDIATGLLTINGSAIATDTNPSMASISPDGNQLYIGAGSSRIYAFDINSSTGILTANITPYVASGAGSYTIAISADGRSVYMANLSSSTISIYNRNTSNGALTAASQLSVSSYRPFGLVISPDQKSVYASDFYNNNVYMFRRNTNTTDFMQYRTDLSDNTLTYYRAYATNSVGTGYSSSSSFTTLP